MFGNWSTFDEVIRRIKCSAFLDHPVHCKAKMAYYALFRHGEWRHLSYNEWSCRYIIGLKSGVS